MKLWSGRFSRDTASEVEAYVESLEVDEKMVLEDIWGSKAHTLMLAKQKIITKSDARKILRGLERIESDYLKGKLTLDRKHEDVHMNVEEKLIRLAGDAGKKLHTARSRNDQVNADSRLYARTRLLDVAEAVIRLQTTLLAISGKNKYTVMPGYTHTQEAQPITLAYWATAYVSMLMRDLRRLLDAYDNVNVSPLGACALAGTSFKIDREFTAKLLGFDRVLTHSLDAVSSRDFMLESASALALLMADVSRMAEELVLWSTFEFGMITLADEYTTGSSIMPQKKNPDVAELARGRTGRVYGTLIQLLTTMKSLPMGYNRDLQEDKPMLWDAFDTVKSTLDVVDGMLSTAAFNKKRMAELAGANFTTATEFANYLVREKNMPFRESHRIVGNIVRALASAGKDFSDISAVKTILAKNNINVSETGILQTIDPIKSVQTYSSTGSSSPEQTSKMASTLEKESQKCLKLVLLRRTRIQKAQELTEKAAKSYIA